MLERVESMGSGTQQPAQPSAELVEGAARVQSLEDLAQLLRALRRRHARANRDTPLTYRELAGRTGWSLSAIAEYFTARTLPPTDRFDALLGVLGASPAELRALAGARDRLEESLRGSGRRRTDQAVASRSGGGGAETDRVPRQLPARTALFTGRERELARLLDTVGGSPVGGTPGTVVIWAIDGMGGIGKTALAVHVAHQVVEYFPDGQLFLDLRGFTQDAAPRDPGDALAVLLGASGVAPDRIPADTDARAGLYRERLAGTRTLVVLDNAVDEAQVRPLLPATSGCLVLITSRRRLKALDDAVPVSLDVLSPGEAVALLKLAAHVGSDGVEDEDAGWARVATLCGYVPLALVIAGALLRTGGKAWTLERLIDRLAARRPGDELAGYTDEVRSLSAVFDLSYRSLGDAERSLFRYLALLPGSEIDAYAAAALLDCDLNAADVLVQRLADQSLLSAVAPGRYRVHDLVRAYAHSLAREDSEQERAGAVDRLLRYYAYTGQRASLLVARRPRLVPAGSVPACVPVFTEPSAARAWLRAEHATLDAAFGRAHADGLHEHTIALAAALADVLEADGSWTRALEIQEAAAETAAHHGQPADHANALTDLGRVYELIDDSFAASQAHSSALSIYREIGERHGEAVSLVSLGGGVRIMTADYPEAEEALRLALHVFREIGDPHGVADARYGLGRVLTQTGGYPAAADELKQALDIYRETGNRRGEARALHDLGRVRYMTGDFAESETLAVQSLDICSELGDRSGEAMALIQLGRVRQMTGDYPGAEDVLSRALGRYRGLGSRVGEANALNMLGNMRYVTGDYRGAETDLADALEIHREIGNRVGEADVLVFLGYVWHTVGDHPAAIGAFTQALGVFRGLGQRGGEATALIHLGLVRLYTGDHPAAGDAFTQALEIERELGQRSGEANALMGLGRVRHAGGDYAAAEDALARALEIHRALGARGNEAFTLNYYAAVFAATDRRPRALDLYTQALAMNRELHKPDDEAVSLEGIADHYFATGDDVRGAAHLDGALAIYERLGMRAEAERVRSRIQAVGPAPATPDADATA
ncbi:MAG TPA: tetratricopeptide repeat protein [Actinospica sp.]|jgi:tetratricopeptide (TPR) repeat protein|nr:tetratricopeptide repeat protein [Actinospica sp.]